MEEEYNVILFRPHVVVWDKPDRKIMMIVSPELFYRAFLAQTIIFLRNVCVQHTRPVSIYLADYLLVGQWTNLTSPQLSSLSVEWHQAINAVICLAHALWWAMPFISYDSCYDVEVLATIDKNNTTIATTRRGTTEVKNVWWCN